MFLDISVVLGIAETVVMPPVLKLLIMLRPSLNLNLGRVFISNGWIRTQQTSWACQFIYYSLVVFTIVLFKFLLVSLNKSAFYV